MASFADIMGTIGAYQTFNRIYQHEGSYEAIRWAIAAFPGTSGPTLNLLVNVVNQGPAAAAALTGVSVPPRGIISQIPIDPALSGPGRFMYQSRIQYQSNPNAPIRWVTMQLWSDTVLTESQVISGSNDELIRQLQSNKSPGSGDTSDAPLILGGNLAYVWRSR